MAFAKKEKEVLEVKAPKIERVVIRIKGTAPLVQHKFSQKSKQIMMDEMAKKTTEKKKKSPRDYEQDLNGAQHISTNGWVGIPCSAFRAAMVRACATTGAVMTQAKLALFVMPDGFDADDGMPLVKLIAGDPERSEMYVRNKTGTDIRVRPMWREWQCDVPIEFDADMMSASTVVNLLARAGRQVGIGEGRPFSKESVGMGWGTFEIVEE